MEIKIDLTKLIQETVEQVAGSDERELLQSFLLRNGIQDQHVLVDTEDILLDPITTGDLSKWFKQVNALTAIGQMWGLLEAWLHQVEPQVAEIFENDDWGMLTRPQRQRILEIFDSIADDYILEVIRDAEIEEEITGVPLLDRKGACWSKFFYQLMLFHLPGKNARRVLPELLGPMPHIIAFEGEKPDMECTYCGNEHLELGDTYRWCEQCKSGIFFGACPICGGDLKAALDPLAICRQCGQWGEPAVIIVDVPDLEQYFSGEWQPPPSPAAGLSTLEELRNWLSNLNPDDVEPR